MTSTSATTKVLPRMGARGTRGRSAPAPRRPGSKRIGRVVSLDAARGLLVLATVAWLAAPRRPFPASEAWGALALDALAMPAFALVAGCAFAMAQHRGWTSGGRVAARSLRLIAVGLAVAAVVALIDGAAAGIPVDPAAGSFGGIERMPVAGPLVQLGVAVAALGLLGILAGSWAGWVAATALSTIAGAGTLWLASALCGPLSDVCSPATLLVGGVAEAAGVAADARVVQAVTTALAGLGLALPAAAGAALAHGFLRARSVTRRQRARVAGYGVLAATLFAVLGVIAHFTPTMWGQEALQPTTALWTPPLTLAVAALAAVLAAVTHPLVDTDLRGGTSALGAAALPLAAAGRISLLAIATTLAARGLLEALPDPDPVGAFAALGDIPSVVLGLVVAALWLAVALRAERSGRRLRP